MKEKGNPSMDTNRAIWKKAVLLSLFFILHPSSFILSQEVEWRQDYQKARQEAADKSRPLFIDLGTDNCFWCKQLDARTFKEPGVAAILNERFVPLKIDASRDPRLADALRVQNFPTLVFANSEGRILGYQEGFVEAAALKEVLERLAPAAAKAPPASPNLEGPASEKLTSRAKVKPEGDEEDRLRRARDLLGQAREDYRAQQILFCLDRCELLANNYADLPEGAEAAKLATEIKSNPEWMKQACDQLADRMSQLYLSLAETWLKKGQPQQAIYYLERIVQSFPNSRHAEAAQVRLAQIQGQPSATIDFKK
jgi:thioredoxin-related protein